MTKPKSADAAQIETTSGVPVPAGDDGLVTLDQQQLDELEIAAGGIEPYVRDGFPVYVSVDGDDGELRLDDYRTGSTHRFDIVDGVTAAHTRARLELLTSIGGTPLLDYSPAGDAAGSDAGGDKS